MDCTARVDHRWKAPRRLLTHFKGVTTVEDTMKRLSALLSCIALALAAGACASSADRSTFVPTSDATSSAMAGSNVAAPPNTPTMSSGPSAGGGKLDAGMGRTRQ